MKEIICDTNVWYDLDENIQIENAKLIPTFCNIFELAHTLNKGASIKAAETLLNGGYLESTYFFNPYSHIMFLDNGKAPFLQTEAIIKDLFLAFAQGKINKAELEQESKPLLKEKELKDIANTLNEPMVKDNVPFDNDQKSVIEWTKVYISYMITNWAKTTLGLNYEMRKDFDWNQIELFLNTLALFNRKMVFNKMKYSAKDMVDLWNMVYVKPGNLYWTWEGINRETNEMNNKQRWHKLIHEAGMGNYLFLP